MAEIKSSYEILELNDGTPVNLTLNFKKLLWLRGTGHEKEVNEAMRLLSMGKDFDILMIPNFIWVSYLCANDTPAYTEEEFFELLPWDLTQLSNIIAALNTKKKGTPFKKRSNA